MTSYFMVLLFNTRNNVLKKRNLFQSIKSLFIVKVEVDDSSRSLIVSVALHSDVETFTSFPSPSSPLPWETPVTRDLGSTLTPAIVY